MGNRDRRRPFATELARGTPGSLLAALAIGALGSCTGRSGYATDAPAQDTNVPETDPLAWNACQPGQSRCAGLEVYQVCRGTGEYGTPENTDCHAMNERCSATLGGCVPCLPGQRRCTADTSAVEVCKPDGSGWDPGDTCDTLNGMVCRMGECRSLCQDQSVVGTNIGCEYYAVDLDNYNESDGNAAAQQYAVIVSNPDPHVSARVRVEWNTAPVGSDPRPSMVASAVIPPMDLEVFPLPPREVDCSIPGTFNTGTGTCLSSQAYRVTSTVPVIAFQFNPLSNVQVFSNDASLLVPTNSLTGEYRVMSWPETLASHPPERVLNPGSPVDLRGFIAVVGVQPGTHVHVVPQADVIPGGPLLERTPAGGNIDVTLGPFDVLNLETDDQGADLTGSIVVADGPVAVFSGSECSDVPAWSDLNDRRCCCDHLESQQFPRDTLGQHYVAVHTAQRTPAVRAAGAPVALVEHEPEFFRVMAVYGDAHVTTTVPTNPDDPASPLLAFDLHEGEYRTLRAYGSFVLDSTAPVSVANFMASQLNTGIPLNFPGGDGSFIPMPPVEQWRDSYVFLTPDKYAFDFVSVVAREGTEVRLDGDLLPTIDCDVARGDGCEQTMTHACPPSQYSVYTCQLSYPTIDPSLPYPQNTMPGRQRDGVHTVTASAPVEVIVSGFDLRVSYGYPAGTQLRRQF